MAAFELDDRGIILSCNACGGRNRLRYDRLAHDVRCGHCKEPLSPPSEPLSVSTSGDFDRLVSKTSVPILVDYWAPWCGPCRAVAPELQKVAASHAGRALVVKVNTDEVPELGQRFGIRSIPTLALFVDGREVSRMTGARPAKDIEAFMSASASSSASATRSAHQGPETTHAR